MDPTTLFCPHPACPARGQVGQGTLGIHARKDKRFLCTQCRKTVAAPTGTAFYRLRTPAATVALVLTRLAHGCPLHAIVVACGVDERTVAAWAARAGRQGQAIQEDWVEQPRDVGQVQAAASRVQQQGGIAWMALAMLVTTRVWRGGAGSEPRAMPLSRRRSERVRRCAARRPLVICPDGMGSSMRAVRETVRAPVHTGRGGRPRLRPWRPGLLAQVVTRDERLRVGAIARRLIDGTPARVETLRRRSQGDGGIHTASLERLTATFRAHLVSLTRRGRALARRTLTLQHGMSLIGTVYNCYTPHASLTPIGGGTTPAMAAGITDHGWTVQALLSYHVPPPRWTPPPPRGRPAQALTCLIDRWCGNHG